MSEPLIVFEGVEKRYGDVVAVKHLDLTIDKGEFVALMGPSGCGKTTTLRMLAGLEEPSAGDIRIGGRSMHDIPAHERDTPMVWQSLALFPFLDVIRENVEFGLKMRGVACSRTASRRALDWLDRLGHRRIRGPPRRPALRRPAPARGARPQPSSPNREILLLDEPLSALDAHLVIRMQGVLTQACNGNSASPSSTSPIPSQEAFAMADRVVIMVRRP